MKSKKEAEDKEKNFYNSTCTFNALFLRNDGKNAKRTGTAEN